MLREAADIAYYFKWPKSEIMTMTKRERFEWISQINRIHEEELRQRAADSENELQRILQVRGETSMNEI